MRRRRPSGLGAVVMAVTTGLALAVAGCSVSDPRVASTSGASPATSAPAPAVSTAPSAWEACWSAPPTGTGPLAFVDRTDALGLGAALTAIMAHAMAAGDVDDDGWVDLFVGGFADRPVTDYAVRGASGPAPDRLLLGSAHGFAIDQRFPGEQARTAGAAFADLDGDGDLDLIVSRNPRPVDRGRAPTVVLRNDDGRFTQASVLDDKRGGRSIGVLDADGDGLLDLVLVEDRWSGGSTVLYRNQGGLRFADATAAFGLPTDVHGLGVSTADLDGDRRPDLFVSGSNRLFLNTGGRFDEQTGDGFTWPTYGDEDDPAGVAAGDLDGDGRPELVIGQHYNSTLDFGRRVPVRVYANRGPGDGRRVRFVDVTAEAGLPGLPTKSPHVELVDLDADGRLDILTTAATSTGDAPVVLRNVTSAVGRLRFESVVAPGSRQYWVTAATFDADHDGALDVALAEWEPTRPSLLLSASGQRGHWLAVEVGRAGSAGIGAEVSVYRPGHAGEAEHLLGRREIAAQTGFAAGAEPVARFGLGEATLVDVEIEPAGGGKTIRFTGIETDRLVRVGAACPH